MRETLVVWLLPESPLMPDEPLPPPPEEPSPLAPVDAVMPERTVESTWVVSSKA
ncbi:hypothetical protein D3C72_2591340 [compost metagenome]